MMRLLSTLTVLTTFLLLLATACSSRVETAVTAVDSTIVYPSKKADGVSARITLFRRVSKKTGKLIGEGKVFTIKQNRKLRALIEMDRHSNQELMLHIDWIGTDQKSFLRKQLHILPGDSTPIKSSISISPEIRQAGKYKLRVYLFRELIAEKEFELLPEFWFTKAETEKTKAEISFYRKMSRKNPGKRIGEDTVFVIRKKRNLRADILLEYPPAFYGHELNFKLNWVNPEGKTFFKKKIIIAPGDTTTVLHSSVSISTGKRKAGNYSLKVYLFEEMIAKKNFSLKLHPNKH